jgi:hypothetical protein
MAAPARRDTLRSRKAAALDETVTAVVQINGKVRDRLQVKPTRPRTKCAGWHSAATP